MPMNAGTLKSDIKGEIKTALQAQFTIVDLTMLDKFADAVAQAVADKVVAHIQTNAQVTTSCGAGPGTGTIA